MSISSSTTNSSSNINNTKNEEINEIKFGILSQETQNLNATSLFTSYLSNSKTKLVVIKNDYNYEFIPDKYQNLTITINHIKNLRKIVEIYNLYNAFIILIDIQTKKCFEELSTIIDCILDATETDKKNVMFWDLIKIKKKF